MRGRRVAPSAMHLRPQPRVRRVPTGRQDAVSLCCLLFGAQVGRRSAWQPFVFIELEGVKHRRRTTARDREAARPQPDPDHGALCASGAGFGQGLGGAGRRQYRRGFAERRWCHSGETGGGAVVTLGRARQKGLGVRELSERAGGRARPASLLFGALAGRRSVWQFIDFACYRRDRTSGGDSIPPLKRMG